MRISEMLKRDRERLAQMDRRQKVQFIWDYYKIPIIAAAVVIVVGASVLISSLTRGNVTMYAVLVNSDAQAIECDEGVFASALEKAGYDLTGRKVDVRVDLNMGEQYSPEKDGETLQVLTALFAISDMDIYVAPKYYFDIFARDDGFADLKQILTEEQLSRYRDILYYYSADKPCGIILNDGSLLHKAGYYHSEVIIGIVGNAVNMQAATDFLKQLLSEGN